MPKKNHSPRRHFCQKAMKTEFYDRVDAELMREHIELRARRTAIDVVRSYQCPFGNHWHLTSQDQIIALRHSA